VIVRRPIREGSIALLRAAVLDGHAAGAAWSAWLQAGGSLDRVERSSFCLLPLLYRTLESCGIADPQLPVLKGIYRHAFVSNQRLVVAAASALESLGTNGVAAMLLDGAAAGAVHYRDAACRPLDAVDVRIRRDDAERALSVLGACGWREPARAESRPGARTTARLTHVTDGGALVLSWPGPSQAADDKAMWAAAVPTVLGQVTTTAPDATHQLLHACAQPATVGGATLQSIVDAAVILRSGGEQIVWPRLVEAVTRRRRSADVVRVLEPVCGELEAPVPTSVLVQLRSASSRPRERLRSWSTQVTGLRPRR
jgi:hypothetical protein